MIFLIFSSSFKSPASGKENVRFPDSPDFENLPDFRTGRDVRQSPTIDLVKNKQTSSKKQTNKQTNIRKQKSLYQSLKAMMTLAIFQIILYHHLPKGLGYVALYFSYGRLSMVAVVCTKLGMQCYFFSKLYIWHSTLFHDDDVTFTLFPLTGSQ